MSVEGLSSADRSRSLGVTDVARGSVKAGGSVLGSRSLKRSPSESSQQALQDPYYIGESPPSEEETQAIGLVALSRIQSASNVEDFIDRSDSLHRLHQVAIDIPPRIDSNQIFPKDSGKLKGRVELLKRQEALRSGEAVYMEESPPPPPEGWSEFTSNLLAKFLQDFRP